MVTVKMSSGEKLKFFGPMMIVVNKGLISILDKKFGEKDRIVIHKLKSYVVEAVEDSELDINMGADSQIQRVEELDPYDDWLRIADKILEKNPEIIMIVGGVDCGKSTFTILLSNKAIDKGWKPAIIDADVGQADIGPPGFVSMAYPDQKVIWMRELKPYTMRFIGDIKPQHSVDRIIYCVRELSDKAITMGRRPVIIDTDGWIGDEYALSYKYRLVHESGSKTLVVIGEDYQGLFRVFEKHGVGVYETRAPVIRKTRSRDERRLLRRDKYREYLAEAPLRKIPLDEVIVIGFPILYGSPIQLPNNVEQQILENTVYASKLYNTLYIVATQRFRNEWVEHLKNTMGIEKIKIYTDGFEKNTYVGLIGLDGEYPGLVERINYLSREIVVKTPYNGLVRKIVFSNIKLSEEYVEQINTTS